MINMNNWIEKVRPIYLQVIKILLSRYTHQATIKISLVA